MLVAGAPLTSEETIRGPEGRSTSSSRPASRSRARAARSRRSALIAADVSEIRRAETDRAQLAALVQAAPDAIVARDRDGLITTWNPGAEAMFGLRPSRRSAAATTSCSCPTRSASAFNALIAEVYAGRTTTVRSYRLRADGSRFPAQVSMAPLKLLDGSWHGTLSMIRDITDLVQAESELRDRAALLERSNADLERFAYAASHDLQEPLNSIRLSAGAVIEAAERAPRRRRARADGAHRRRRLRLSGQVRGLMEVAQVAIGRDAGRAAAARGRAARRDRLAARGGHLRAGRDRGPPAGARRRGAAHGARRRAPERDRQRDQVPPARRPAADRDHRRGRRGAARDPRGRQRASGSPSRTSTASSGSSSAAPSDLPGTGMGLAVARRMLERLGGSMLAASEGPGAAASSRCCCRSAPDGQLRRGLRGGLEPRGLAEVAVGTGLQRGLLGVLVGEHEDRAAGTVRAQLAGDLQAVELAASRGRARRRRAPARARAPAPRSRRPPRRRARGPDAR